MYWYVRVLRKYANFSGRARRKEYWMFDLVNVLISVVLGLLQLLITAPDVQLAVSMFALCYSLAVLVPGLAVTTRRLHDTDRSGWWQLFVLVPFVGGIILLVWLASDGDADRNHYGPDPKNEAESDGAIASGEEFPTTRARWILPLTVVTVIAVATGGFLHVVSRGTAEARTLSHCMGIRASAEEVANVDLTPLGLRSAATLDARSIYGDLFVDGAAIQYAMDDNPAAVVAVLRYASSADAAKDFAGISGWAEESCGRWSSFNFGAQGVIHCYLSDGHDVLLWSDNWILDIETADMNGLPGAELAVQVRDALVVHWQALQSRSFESLQGVEPSKEDAT